MSSLCTRASRFQDGLQTFVAVLYDASGAGIKLEGGRDTTIVNNLIVKCGNAFYADSRAFEWLKSLGFPNNIPGDSWNLLEKLNQLGYQQEPWLSRYPECAAIPNDWTTIIDPTKTWLFPEGTVISRNLGWSNFRWLEETKDTSTHYKLVTNNVQDQDPLFTDEASLNLLLKPNSPAFLIPSFEDIPFDEIGIRK